jgi:hypothetical protein
VKKVLLALALSVSAFGATYESNLYPHPNHVEMYECESGVKAAFNVWTADRSTLSLQNFKLGFHSCGYVAPDKRVYVLKLKSGRAGNVWVGTHAESGRSVRVYDYRKASLTGRIQAPFVVEEYDANQNLIQRLQPAIASRG